MTDFHQEISPQDYYSLLKELAYESKGYGKTADVCAYELVGIKICTKTSGGQVETEREVKLEPVHLCFDPKMHPTKMGREAIMERLAILWAAKVVGKRELSSNEVEGPGVWVSENKKFHFDYIPKGGHVNDFGETVTDGYSPNPEAVRLAIILDKDTVLSAPWASGQFIAKGGSLAMREAQLPELLRAIEQIERGEVTIEKALYTTNDSGERVARFDIYPMEGPTAANPKGFLLGNYGETDLKPETIEARKKSREVFSDFAITRDKVSGRKPVSSVEGPKR
ncbi:MAG: hypothetical protein PHS57_03110 [Alphaproteobacteria bacterium]|nr:hypothetical protein [Alphaproteobacteria bacterium]